MADHQRDPLHRSHSEWPFDFIFGGAHPRRSSHPRTPHQHNANPAEVVRLGLIQVLVKDDGGWEGR